MLSSIERSRPILLVEDNPAEVELARLALERNHIHSPIIIANNGAEALDYIFCTGPYFNRDIHDHPQVILLDIQLPGMDGIEVLRRIREDRRTRTIPVVIMTTSDEEKDLEKAYLNGTNAFVRKPVSFGEFTEAIGKLSSFWLTLNEVCPKRRHG